MCVSHKTVNQIRMVKSLGRKHDQPVIRWKEAIEGKKSTPDSGEHHSGCDEESESSDTSSDEGSVVTISLNAADNCDAHARLRYILTGDNIDKNVSPRNMTLDHQVKSLHYFHAYAALSRIDFSGLSEETPTSRLLRSLDSSAFLPSIADCQVLRENYVILSARVICDTLTAFSSFKECVPKHILHKYSAAMSKKSVTVSSSCEILSVNVC